MECIHPKSKGAQRCRSCAVKFMATDPDIQRRRREGIARYHAQPGVKLEYRERLRKTMERVRSDPIHQEKLRAHGHWLAENVLRRPDVQAACQTPEARAKRAARLSATRMRDIPQSMRAEYRRLVHSKRIPAAEAKEMVLEEYRAQMRAGQ